MRSNIIYKAVELLQQSKSTSILETSLKIVSPPTYFPIASPIEGKRKGDMHGDIPTHCLPCDSRCVTTSFVIKTTFVITLLQNWFCDGNQFCNKFLTSFVINFYSAIIN